MPVASKWGLILVQLTGVLLSVFLLVVTFGDQKEVELRLQSFAIAKVEQAAKAAWDERTGQIAESPRIGHLKALAQRFDQNAEQVNAVREQVVPALIAYSLSNHCPKSCDYSKVVQVVDTALLVRAAQYRVGQVTLQDFIVERYDTTVRGLISDLRRFALVNVVALSLMMGLVIFRNHLNWRFVVMSLAVTGYTAWAAYGYLFGQNWAYSILFQDWAAPGYQFAMILMSCLFADWLFLSGRLTQLAIQAVASVLPC